MIAATPPEQATNENGFPNPDSETARVVFASKKSAGYNEFYKAQQAGYTLGMKFDVYAEEYQGEPIAKYEGRRYRVLRTYLSKNGEITELTLSDLKEGGSRENGAV